MDYDMEQTLAVIENIDLSLLGYCSNSDSEVASCLRPLFLKLWEARRSYLLLMKHECYTDAVIIAGHIIENCASILYIIGVSKKENKHALKYKALDTVQTIKDLLGLVKEDEIQEELLTDINVCIEELSKIGHCLLDTRTQHNCNILKLKAAETTKESKLEILSEYESKTIADRIKQLQTAMKEFYVDDYPDIADAVGLLYAAYCKVKHCGVAMYNAAQLASGYSTEIVQYREISYSIVALCLDFISSEIKSKLANSL